MYLNFLGENNDTMIHSIFYVCGFICGYVLCILELKIRTRNVPQKEEKTKILVQLVPDDIDSDPGINYEYYQKRDL